MCSSVQKCAHRIPAPFISSPTVCCGAFSMQILRGPLFTDLVLLESPVLIYLGANLTTISSCESEPFEIHSRMGEYLRGLHYATCIDVLDLT